MKAEKEFIPYNIPYELALRLKQINFKERVLTYYEDGVPKLYNNIMGWDFNTSFLTCVSRPTFSQAFRWIFENFNYFVCFVPCSQHKYFHFEIRLQSSIVYDTLDENFLCDDIDEINRLALNKLLELLEYEGKFKKK